MSWNSYPGNKPWQQPSPYPPPNSSPYPPPNASPYPPPNSSPYPPPSNAPYGSSSPSFPDASSYAGTRAHPGYTPSYDAPQMPPHHSRPGGYQPPGPPPPLDSYRPYPSSVFTPPPGPPPPQHYGAPSGPPPPGSMQPPNFGPVHYEPVNRGDQWWSYSQCSGKRKALCIGINYVGTRAELKGCWNDAENVKKFLIERYNFQSSDFVMLMDKPGMAWNERPTKQNMMNAMRWLVSNAQPNDSLFFHYSGHGGQQKDKHGDEEDGYDETIYPVDFEEVGEIVDDELHDVLVRSLPAGCRLTAIFDCCHSGSALDLPYMYSTEGKIKEPNMLADAGQGAMGAVSSYLRGDMKGVFSSVAGLGKTVLSGGGKTAAEKTKRNNTSPADVIMWSGCKDTQTSADTQEAGQATGAMSYAFISSLTKMPQQTYKQLLNTIRDELQGRYSQKPQLSASHPIDVDLLFIV